MARRLGATDEQIDAVHRDELGGFEPAWRSALAYADAVTPVGANVPDALFAALAEHWEAAQIVEITAVVALFSYFNRFALALRIPITR